MEEVGTEVLYCLSGKRQMLKCYYPPEKGEMVLCSEEAGAEVYSTVSFKERQMLIRQVQKWHCLSESEAVDEGIDCQGRGKC
jgi:hypothetical protein